ncbi:MAG: hypothetical protein QOJ80_4277 [Mycobacterium sp.]|jgi:hypothetical protein|nr:hypothetical protein [Mycobacterium sp.]
MTQTTHVSHAPLLRRLLDGGRTWGALEISASRYGLTRYRLVVFPPGISGDERIALRLWRTFPAWGLVSWLLAEVTLMTVVSPGPALAFATGGCAAMGAVTMALAGHTRHLVRRLTVVRMVGVNDPMAGPRLDELRTLTERLTNADARLAAGELTTVDHEAEVWRVYDQMPAT